MTNILAICSALNNTYTAFKYNNETFSKLIKSDDKNYHSLYLIKEIKDISQNIHFELKNLDLITVNLGPGSFTGIRVALSIAKVMSQELNIPLVGLNTAEILLNTYNCDYLIMDARRDMYYIGTKDDIKLVYKNDLPVLKGKILADKRSMILVSDAICYEDKEDNIANTMLELAENKYNSSNNKEEFNYMCINANYIQTPPIFVN